MKFLLILLVTVHFVVISAYATIHRVAKDGSEDFTTIQSAVNEASDDDTVMVRSDINPYVENVYIQTRVTIIGSGIACGNESDPVVSGKFTFSGNSAGSLLTGLTIHTSSNSFVDINVSMVILRGCYIDGNICVVVNQNAGVHVIACFLKSEDFQLQIGAYGVLTVENSIFYAGRTVYCTHPESPATVLVRNCSFLDQINTLFYGVADWTIDNCVFWNVPDGIHWSGSWHMAYNAFPENMLPFPFVAGVDTIINSNPWVVPSDSLCISDWHLSPGSGLIDHGDPSAAPDRDGTRRDLGAFGGPSPFKPNLTPALPFVTSISLPASVPQNGALEIRSTGRVGQGN
jgi:hypothetical protein